MKMVTVGLDIPKQILQVHGLDRSGKVVLRKSEVGNLFA
jgi:hypothetical protein